ncbi:unnamed protein product [Heterosigma akashiwo]
MESLTEQQQQSLNEAKVQLRIENEEYLRKHPELKQLISHFMSKVLEERPENVNEFAKNFFGQDGVESEVNAKLASS